MLGEILTAIVTPFKADGSVDLDRFRELARHLVDNGSDGFVVTGTTGEAPTLTDDERFALYAAAVGEVGDRATVVAGTGTYSTAHSIHLTKRADEIGVDGFLVVTPYYNLPPQRGIVAHFQAVAAATAKPVVAYNIPGRVIRNIEPETVAQLAEIPNVVAVKQANADLEQARRIVELGLDLYAGDVDGARAIDEELRPAIDLLRVTTNPIGIKAALALVGQDVGGLRLPLVEASDDEREAIKGCLERLGLLQPAAA